jgi:hypothetical protein
VIGKILLLEDRYRDDFELLAATPDAEMAELLRHWEGWAQGDEDYATPPKGISEGTRVWAAAEPHLANVQIAPYITLAATLVAASVSADLSDELAELVPRLVGPSEADRGLAQNELAKRGVAQSRQVVAALLSQARRLHDVTAVIDALVGIAEQTPDVAEEVATGIREDCWRRLEPASVASLAASNVPVLVAMLPDLATDAALEPDIREAARQMQEA